MSEQEIISSDKRLKIQVLGMDEPNNGRMVLRSLITLDGAPFEHGHYNLNFELSRLKVNDPFDRFYYLPLESQAKLVGVRSGEVAHLPFQPCSTARFRGNLFSDDYLLEFFDDELCLTDLRDFSSSIFQPTSGKIESAEFIGEERILLAFRKSAKREDERKRTVTLDSFSPINRQV